ncbi:MAG: hypothetical protein V7K27_23440 [Nostoc sp.]
MKICFPHSPLPTPHSPLPTPHSPLPKLQIFPIKIWQYQGTLPGLF